MYDLIREVSEAERREITRIEIAPGYKTFICWSISKTEKERRPPVKLKCKQEGEVTRLGKNGKWGY